jgi:hypothetical protein
MTLLTKSDRVSGSSWKDGFKLWGNMYTYCETSHGRGADAVRYVCDEVAQLRRRQRESASARGRMNLVGVTECWR